ncbi:MAG: AAA family ATPase [Bacteroidaceae bacterium]|nr:AAA family ATPase [Bacteroidaceae bacterium]
MKRIPFVFIIDEINRGEISKIFGELFYSIDAGYRGIKGRVETQYQNLVPEDDVFSKGFYIPQNVYIIGTMNDIDRSVESMDFAMRRRFAWKEITAESRQSMLDEDEAWGTEGKPSEKVIDEMKVRMDNLNSAIIDQYGDEELSNKDKVGLTKAYQIGAAYFLKYVLYNNFKELWTNHLEGLLYEYLRGKTNVDEKIKRLYQAYNDTTTH